MDKWLQRYVDVLESLNKENLSSLDSVLAEQIDFRDPFNHTYIRSDFLALLDDMYTKLGPVNFDIHQANSEGPNGMIYWTFSASNSPFGEISFNGMSRLLTNEQGIVILHHDFWDGSELMERVPLAGAVVRFLRSKLRHD
jgi:hypothetical protein